MSQGLPQLRPARDGGGEYLLLDSRTLSRQHYSVIDKVFAYQVHRVLLAVGAM